jgi:hypothetical protein
MSNLFALTAKVVGTMKGQTTTEQRDFCTNEKRFVSKQTDKLPLITFFTQSTFINFVPNIA